MNILKEIFLISGGVIIILEKCSIITSLPIISFSAFLLLALAFLLYAITGRPKKEDYVKGSDIDVKKCITSLFNLQLSIFFLIIAFTKLI